AGEGVWFCVGGGPARRAPAFDPLPRWRIQREGARVFVPEKLAPTPKPPAADSEKRAWPESVVIVGGGAAGFAAAEMLRRQGYDRPVTLLSADADPPCDRPNLSKDYLAGTPTESSIP